MILWYLFIFALTISVISTGTNDLVISDEKTTYGNIPNNCFTPDPDNDKNHEELLENLKKSQIKSVWLNILKINLTKWTWLDASVQGSRISSAEWTKAGRDCAVLRVGEKFIDDVYCNDNYNLTICEDISNRSCTNCIWHGGKTYSVEENKDSTWFDAKHHCAVQNKSLAVFPREDVSKVTDLLTPVFEGWTNKNAWIGLRLTEYYIQSNNGNRSMYRYFWGSKEPCPCPEKKCVIMKKWSPNAYYWVPANCSEKHNYICNRTTGSALTVTIPGPITPGASKTLIASIAAAAGCIVVLLLILIAAVTLYFKCYKKKRKRGTHAEQIPMVTKPDDDIWETVFKGLSRQLASDAKKPDHQPVAKQFLTQVLKKTEEDIQKLDEDKKLDHWETYLEELEKWRGNKSRKDAWMEMKKPVNELSDKTYKEIYEKLTVTARKGNKYK